MHSQHRLFFFNLFFSSTLRKGKQKLHLWPNQEADGQQDTTTPSKIKNGDNDDMNKLEKVYSVFYTSRYSIHRGFFF